MTDTKSLQERLLAPTGYDDDGLRDLLDAAAEALDAQAKLIAEAVQTLHAAAILIGHPDDPVTQAFVETANKLEQS